MASRQGSIAAGSVAAAIGRSGESSSGTSVGPPGLGDTAGRMLQLATAETLGYLAALLTTASFVPQVVHTLRTRDVAGISVGMYSVFTVGVALWLAYGVMLRAWPVIVANLVTLVLATWILGLKLVIQRQQRR